MYSTRRLKLALLVSVLAAGAACGPEGCCAPPVQSGTGIQVVNGNVRACDLVFRAAGDEVPSVTFGATVNGEFVPKAPLLAVSFIARDDASLEGQELATLVFRGTSEPAELVSASCADATGAALSGDVVRLSE